MLKGSDVQAFVSFLETHNLSFWHACQLKDFASYCKVGGVPSRALLAEGQFAFTGFETDEVDKRNDVNNLVFGNLSDFGKTFEHGQGALPNVYGPISLKFEPAVLLSASEIAFCNVSAGKAGFDRIAEALSIEDIKKQIRTSDKGTVYFEGAPELSLEVPKQFVSFAHLSQVLVDNYSFENGHLLTQAQAHFRPFTTMFQPRFKIRNGNHQMLAEIVAAGGGNTIDSLRKNLAGTVLQDWSKRVPIELDYQVNRFSNYLREGTLENAGRLRKQISIA